MKKSAATVSAKVAGPGLSITKKTSVKAATKMSSQVSDQLTSPTRQFKTMKAEKSQAIPVFKNGNLTKF